MVSKPLTQMVSKSLTQYVAPGLLVLGAMLAAANWYLQPDRSASWATVVSLIGFLFLALLLFSRSRYGAARPDAAHSARSSIVFTALMLVIVLSAKLATTLGVLENGELLRRATMTIVGAFLIFTGNRLPKTLTPLATLQCDPARVQAFQRFAGWTWVLTGVAFAMVWLLLPLNIAKPVSVGLLSIGILTIAAQVVRLRATRRREA